MVRRNKEDLHLRDKTKDVVEQKGEGLRKKFENRSRITV
jgi:hypothetical protein